MTRPSLLIAPALALVALGVGPAHAAPAPGAPVQVAAQDAADSCGYRAVEVARWTPALGPAARFIVAAPTRFVALGRTDEGFWSSQWTTPSDACDDCGHLDLVFTRFADGRSTRHPVLREADWRTFDRLPGAGSPTWASTREAAMRELMLRRLWHLAATVWPVAHLRHDYAVVTPAVPPGAAPGEPARYGGWLVGIVQGGKWRVRYTTDVAHLMCWCLPTWRAYVPKP